MCSWKWIWREWVWAILTLKPIFFGESASTVYVGDVSRVHEKPVWVVNKSFASNLCFGLIFPFMGRKFNVLLFFLLTILTAGVNGSRGIWSRHMITLCQLLWDCEYYYFSWNNSGWCIGSIAFSCWSNYVWKSTSEGNLYESYLKGNTFVISWQPDTRTLLSGAVDEEAARGEMNHSGLGWFFLSNLRPKLVVSTRERRRLFIEGK